MSKQITFDRINKAIIAELLKDANIKSTHLSSKLRVPLSTIQRRLKTIQSSPLLKKRFDIDANLLGLGRGEIIVYAEKGKAKEIIQNILQKYRYTNVLSISTRINHIHNIIISIVYKDSTEIYNIIENIKAMPHVITVEWSELVEYMENSKAFETIIGKI